MSKTTDNSSAEAVDTTAPAQMADSAASPQPGVEYVQLEEPIVRGSQSITELGLRKPKAGELRGLSLQALAEVDVETLTKLLPRISVPSITAAEARSLDLPDLVAIGTKVGLFLLKKADRESLGQ